MISCLFFSKVLYYKFRITCKVINQYHLYSESYWQVFSPHFHQNLDPFHIKCYLESQKNLCQSAQISDVWSLGREKNFHIWPTFYPITIMVEIYLRNSEAYGHTKNSKCNKMVWSLVRVRWPKSIPNQSLILPK